MALWNDREEAIEIDLDYKTVKIPAKYKNIAVAGDNISDIIPYRLPTNFRGFDLSGTGNENYVIWVRPDGLKRSSSLVMVETVGEYTYFTWTIPGLAAAIDGEIEVQLLFMNGTTTLYSPVAIFTLLPTLTEINITADDGPTIPPTPGGSDGVIDSSEIDEIFGDNIL